MARPTTHPEPSKTSVAPARGEPPFRLGHRAGLDGVRGVAIILVLIAHLWPSPYSYSVSGVNLFFVLSGFLITALLLEEHSQRGTVNLSAFYTRRFLRLLPALILVLGACTIIAFIGARRISASFLSNEIWPALFYYMNWKQAWDGDSVHLMRHAWSLSIEEQFYIVWPLGLVFLLRRKDPKSLANFVALGIFLSWAVRSLLFLGTAATTLRLYVGLDTRADSILAGSAVAVLVSFGLLPKSAPWKDLLRVAAHVSILGIAAITCLCSWRSSASILVWWLLLSLCSAVLILRIVTLEGGYLATVFSHPGLTYVGKISYGLYLWHYPVLKICESFDWPTWASRSTGMIITVGFSLASYHLVECPFLRLKRHFARRSETLDTAQGI